MTKSVNPRHDYFSAYYQEKVKANPEKLKEENDRVKNYLNNKYKTDPEYKQKKQEYAKNYYNKKKTQKTFC